MLGPLVLESQLLETRVNSSEALVAVLEPGWCLIPAFVQGKIVVDTGQRCWQASMLKGSANWHKPSNSFPDGPHWAGELAPSYHCCLASTVDVLAKVRVLQAAIALQAVLIRAIRCQASTQPRHASWGR